MGANTTTINQIDQPRIYVACLTAYNQGRLHGAWIDAAQEPWAIWDAVQVMLAASPVAGAEEWAIHDHEGFGGLRIHESESFDAVAALAAFIVEYGTLGGALVDYCDGDVEQARRAFKDGYLGCHASLADYMQEATEDSTAIPFALRYYVDWQAMARDAELNGELFAIETGFDAVHVFSQS